MNVWTRNLLKAVFVVGVAATLCPRALAWSHNEHQTNATGATAYDVVKILEGDYTITEMQDWDFAQHDYYHRSVNGQVQTVLRWWNGSVAPGHTGDVCFTAVPLGGSAPHAKIIGAWWTDANGVPLGNYYPALSMEIDFADPANPIVRIGNYQAGDIQVPDPLVNPNFWANGDFTLIGEADPLHVVKLSAAVIDGAMGPAELFVEQTIFDPVLADSFFDVFTNTDILPGEPGELATPLGLPVAFGQSVVLVADLGEGNYDLYNFEAPLPEPCALLLLGCAGMGVICRRRQG